MVLGKSLKYQTLLDSIETPVLALEKDLTVLYCNRTYAQLYGKMAGDLIGKNLFKLFPEKIGTPSHLAYLTVLETDKTKVIELQKGRYYFNEYIYRTPTGILSITQEITKDKQWEESLQASTFAHRNLFDETCDAVFLLDVYNVQIVDVNKTACEMFRYKRDEFLTLNAANLSIDEPPYPQDIFVQWIKRSSDVRSQYMEWKCRDSLGRVFWTEIKSKRLLIDNEMRLAVFIHDITERKYLEKELCDIHNSYQDLYENPSDVIFTHDLGGNFISVNQKAEVVTGYTTEELVKMNIQELAAKDYIKALRAFQYQRLPKDVATNYELGIITGFATEVVLDVNIWPVYKNGKPIAVRGIARNVSDRKLRETNLRVSEKRLASFIEYLPDATMAIDLNGRVVVWNQAMVELTGVKAEDMLGKGDYEYGLAFYDKRRPIMVDLVLRPEEVKQYYSIIEVDRYTIISEFDTPRLRGEGHYLWGQAMPWYDSDGNLIGAIESLRDITERYKRRHELQESEDEVKKQRQHLIALLDNLGSPICTFGTDFQITLVSTDFATILEYDKKELFGKNLAELVIEPDSDIFSEENLSELEANDSNSYEVSFRTAKESPTKQKIIMNPLIEDGKIVGGIIRIE